MAFADLAAHLGLHVKLFAACRSDLRGHNIDEYREAFSDLPDALLRNEHRKLASESKLVKKEYTLNYDAELNLLVNFLLVNLCSMIEIQSLKMQTNSKK